MTERTRANFSYARPPKVSNPSRQADQASMWIEIKDQTAKTAMGHLLLAGHKEFVEIALAIEQVITKAKAGVDDRAPTVDAWKAA